MGSRAPLLILWPGPTDAPPTAAAAITAQLTEAMPGARVKILMAPWDDFHALESLLKTAREQPVVVAAPTGQVPPRRVLDRAIDAGLNPAAVQVVDPWLGLGTDPWSLLGAPAVAARGLALIEAAACRAIAQADAPKAALGLRLPSFAEPATRRELWRALRPQVEVNPWINPVRCRAAGGCSLCAAACPAAAIDTASGVATLRTGACTGCSLCAAACPTGAIAHATAAGEAVAAQVASLLRRAEPQGPGPVVVYACPTALTALERLPAAGVSLPDGILPVSVTCAAATPLYLLLRPLELGAASVVRLRCPARCQYGMPAGSLDSGVDRAAEWLSLVGADPRRVCALPADPKNPAGLVAALAQLAMGSGGGVSGTSLPGVAAAETDRFPAFAALAALIRRHPGHGLLQGNAVPFGRVAVDPSRCTLCGLCTSVCPTAALSLAGGAEPRLLIEPTGCADCTACASICPEQAMQVQPGLDLDEAQDPARVLVSDRAVHCQGCGQPYAPAALVAKIRLSLTREAGGTGLQHLQYCPACRVAALSGARSDPHGST